MKRPYQTVAAAAVAFAGTCGASPTGHFSNVGVAFNQCNFEITVPGFGSGDEDCDGFTISGSGLVNDSIFFVAELTKVETDEADFEIEQKKFGVGGKTKLTGGRADVYGRLTFQKVELTIPGVGSADDDGLGFAGGLSFNARHDINLFAEYEFLSYDESDGGDLKIGIALDVSQFSITGDYRILSLEDDDDIEYELAGFRIGARVNF